MPKKAVFRSKGGLSHIRFVFVNGRRIRDHIRERESKQTDADEIRIGGIPVAACGIVSFLLLLLALLIQQLSSSFLGGNRRKR